MKVGEVKSLVKELDLLEEIEIKANELLAKMNDDEELDLETRDKIIALINLEIDAATIQANTYDKAADAIDQYLVDVDQAIEHASLKMDELEEVIKEDIKKPL